MSSFLAGIKSQDRWQEYHFPDNLTEAQKLEAAKDLEMRLNVEAGLHLTLNPGELLITRSDSPPPGRFRDLVTNFEFAKTGTYQLRAVFDDRLSPPSEGFILDMMKLGHTRERLMADDERYRREAIGRVESNRVSIEVVP